MAEVDILHQKYHSLHKSPQIENFNDANDAIFKFGFFMCQNRRNRGLLGSAAEDF